MPFILTRINVGDYDTWKPMFDDDSPGARRDAKGYRIFRNVDQPGEVFILVEFATDEEAQAGRERLLSSGVLNRFADKDEPKLVEQAEAVGYSPTPGRMAMRPYTHAPRDVPAPAPSPWAA